MSISGAERTFLLQIGLRNDLAHGWLFSGNPDYQHAMPTARPALTAVPRSDELGIQFWLSEVEPIDDGDGDFGFSVYADRATFIAMFTYPNQMAAAKARIAIVSVLVDASFVSTEHS